MDEMVRNNFKNLRKTMNVGQEQLAQFLNLEQSSISKFESGERTITVSNLEKACSLFGINVSDIYRKDGNIIALSPSFRKTTLSSSSLEDISNINKIAMNLIEMDTIMGNRHG